MALKHVATIQVPDPNEERAGVFFDLTDQGNLYDLMPGTKLYVSEEDGSSPELFQDGVMDWVRECFGADTRGELTTRGRRTLEEVLELVQVCGVDRSTAAKLVDYVYDRPVGVLPQEVGGVLVCLAALCHSAGYDMLDCGHKELQRVRKNIVNIRNKNSLKREALRKMGIENE